MTMYHKLDSREVTEVTTPMVGDGLVDSTLGTPMVGDGLVDSTVSTPMCGRS